MPEGGALARLNGVAQAEVTRTELLDACVELCEDECRRS
jgi:hypothetical protein